MKNKNRFENLVLIISSILSLLVGISFFFKDIFEFLNGSLVFYVGMLICFGIEIATYILTRKSYGNYSLFKALTYLRASVSGLKYMEEPSSNVIGYTLVGFSIIMIIIKLIRIDDLRNEGNTSVFINLFSMSLFILLSFLVITNIFKGITNEVLILGFFFVANSVLNLIENVGYIRFKK